MIKKIYKLYDNLTNEQKLNVVNDLATHFDMSKKAIQNNWFFNKPLRGIPTHKQEKTLQILKTY